MSEIYFPRHILKCTCGAEMFVVGREWCAMCEPEKDDKVKDTFVAQHGGDHYQAEYQHWDWATDVGLLYLAGTATKYLSRWRKKSGLDDLLKSRTYLEKMIACWNTVYPDTIDPPANVGELTEKFVQSNNLGEAEADICRLLSNLYLDEDCQMPKKALEILSQLIDEEVKRLAGPPQAR